MSPAADLTLPRRLNRWLLLAGMLLAAGLHFWRLGDLPPGLYHDEAYNGLDALALTQGRLFPLFHEAWELYAADAHAARPAQAARWPVFFEGNFGREPLHVYLMAVSIRWLGATPAALRAVPALAGTVAVATTYLAATALLDPVSAGRPTGPGATRRKPRRESVSAVPLLAALALILLYPTLTFSRFGVRAILFLPLATLAVYSFWQGQARLPGGPSKGQAWPWFLLTGVMLGAAQFTYAIARLLPLLFLLYLPIWVGLHRGAWRRHGASYGFHLLLMTGAAILAAAPLLIFFWRYPYFLIFRTGFVANKGTGVVPGRPWLTWLGNIGRVVAGLFWAGDQNIRHNLPGRPYLDAIQSLFFLGGLASLWRRRSAPAAFLLLWLLVMLLPSILSGDAPHFGRLIGAAPPLALSMALGLNEIAGQGGDWLARRAGRRQSRAPRRRADRAQPGRWRRLAVLMVVLLLIISASWTVVDYFRRYAGQLRLAEAFYVDDWTVGRYAAGEPPTTLFYLTPPQEHTATYLFALGGDGQRWRSFNDAAPTLPLGVLGRPAVYFLPVTEAALLERLALTFPEGEREPVLSHTLAFRTSANTLRVTAPQITDLSLGSPISLVGWELRPAAERLTLRLTWQTGEAVERNYTAFVHLLDAAGQLLSQVDRQPAGYPTADWRPGEIVQDEFEVILPPGLPAGDYWLRTGFYDLATLEPLGPPVSVTRFPLNP